MRKRELEVLGEELLDVWSADVVDLLDLNDLEDVDGPESSAVTGGHVLVPTQQSVYAGALELMAISHIACTASQRDISRYSLYMLCVPERES